MAIVTFTRSAALAGSIMLTACASSPSSPDWPYPEPPESGDWGYQDREDPYRESERDREESYQAPYGSPQDPTTRDEQQPTASTHPTVQALVNQADEQRAAGQLDRAAATLERAIRIVNDDPLPWLRLAEIRFEQGNFIQAENLARRSISFAPRGGTARQSWLLIADIKRLQGNNEAARKAQAEADAS